MLKRFGSQGKPKRSVSIKWKIATITAFSSAIALMLAFEFLIVYDLTVFQKSLDHDLTALAQVIGSNSSGALASHDATTANKALSALRARREIMAAALYDARGHVLGRYLRQGVEGARLPASPKPNGTQVGKGHLEVFQNVRENGKVRGYI